MKKKPIVRPKPSRPKGTLWSRKSGFLDPLDLQYLDGRIWQLTTAFDYESALAGLIRVPVGFVTDFASVPRFFWRVLPPTGRYGKAAVVHDYLYGSHLVAKATARSEERRVGKECRSRGSPCR